MATTARSRGSKTRTKKAVSPPEPTFVGALCFLNVGEQRQEHHILHCLGFEFIPKMGDIFRLSEFEQREVYPESIRHDLWIVSQVIHELYLNPEESPPETATSNFIVELRPVRAVIAGLITKYAPVRLRSEPASAPSKATNNVPKKSAQSLGTG